jgi:hypothetical protein
MAIVGALLTVTMDQSLETWTEAELGDFNSAL